VNDKIGPCPYCGNDSAELHTDSNAVEYNCPHLVFVRWQIDREEYDRDSYLSGHDFGFWYPPAIADQPATDDFALCDMDGIQTPSDSSEDEEVKEEEATIRVAVVWSIEPAELNDELAARYAEEGRMQNAAREAEAESMIENLKVGSTVESPASRTLLEPALKRRRWIILGINGRSPTILPNIPKVRPYVREFNRSSASEWASRLLAVLREGCSTSELDQDFIGWLLQRSSG
jgi:hypothetical protein